MNQIKNPKIFTKSFEYVSFEIVEDNETIQECFQRIINKNGNIIYQSVYNNNLTVENGFKMFEDLEKIYHENKKQFSRNYNISIEISKISKEIPVEHQEDFEDWLFDKIAKQEFYQEGLAIDEDYKNDIIVEFKSLLTII